MSEEADIDLRREVVRRFLAVAPPLLLVKFAERVRSDGGCWHWMGVKDREGYGHFHCGGARFRPYRLSYEWKTQAPFPSDLVPDHLCRNTSCVNPDHIEPVTHRENILRGDTIAGRNARKTHCDHGHPFDEVNTYRWKGGKAGRSRACKTCIKANLRRWRAAHQQPRKQGSARADAKLTEEKVRHLRAERERGDTFTVLCERYGITLGAVHQIVHRKTWKHVL